MAGTVYFGNSSYQTWVKAPASGMDAGSAGYSEVVEFLNGGASVRRSQQTHRNFDMSWTGSMNSGVIDSDLHVIKDFYDGIYGDGPFYWNDPFAVNQNILPPNWAAPMLSEKGWSKLTNTLTPTYTTATVSNAYPTKYVTYTSTGAYTGTEKLVIIIPTGYTLNFGWHGPAAGSSTGIRIIPYLRSTGAADTALNPTKITAGGTTRTNTTVSGTTYSRVEILVATSGAATVNITAMIAQVLKNGASVATGGFISGRGTNALEFSTAPAINYISSEINSGYIEMSTTFTEVL
jgi:hypothetical protein